MKHYLILGGSSPVGQELISLISSKGTKVTYIGRTKIKIHHNNLNFIKFDLSKKRLNKTILKSIFSLKPVTHIISLQRSRDKKDSLETELNISIYPLIDVLDFFIEFYKKTKKKNYKKFFKSIILTSSPASRLIASEQPLSYHFSKSLVDVLTRYYSIKLKDLNTNINAISPAFILKKRAEKFYKSQKKLLRMIKTIIPLSKMISQHDYALAILKLMDNDLSYFNGQVLDLDGGLNVHENASLARMILNFK